MGWDLSAWSIRNPIPTIVLFLVLTIAGVASLQNLGIALDPNIDIPTVQVRVSKP
ncbi:efflux RND transporter permease subunit [Gloeobacter morelensis]|uniref:Efflux RND transporter permease subunit n=1 Tax=Gloeobacter morelensis MG652769 TaxID=2781736 RepID=A0ABY3PSG8_9CYAN|nr:efflux RND transporter permease subunit [Gloeobacter morelensis]UFP96479.1 efflux RND transporter permease subunit [Gloeobacter morelensis MG652769]